MTLDEKHVRNRCTDAVFERGRSYRSEGRIQRLDRFGDTVTARVQGTRRYEVTLDVGENDTEGGCTCPYDGPGWCKHVVAVALAVAAGPPPDNSERVETVLDDVSTDELRGFVRDALAEHAAMREQFLARFGDDHRSVDEYREEIAQLFDESADPMVFEAIDFSRFFDIAEQYRTRDRYLAAATVYRALFEEIDEKDNLIDGAYDHYARTIQTALDGYADCVLGADPTPEEFDTYAGVLETRATTEPRINDEVFWRALDDLEERYNE